MSEHTKIITSADLSTGRVTVRMLRPDGIYVEASLPPDQAVQLSDTLQTAVALLNTAERSIDAEDPER